jgi:RNA polymerase sigma-70 factor, ECF subfamily
MECPLVQSAIELGDRFPPAAARGDVLRRCVEGDEAAWNALYTAHADTARAFLFRLGVRDHQLDDACQEVFLQAFRYLGDFRGDSSFTTWLYRLCATQARKVRTRSRLTQALSRLLLFEAESSFGQADPTLSDTTALFEFGMRALTQLEREVFVLYEIEGVAGRQIAEILACPEPTVWRRLHHARKKFCRVVEKRRGGEP